MLLDGGRAKSTTEARRHGGNQDRVIARDRATSRVIGKARTFTTKGTKEHKGIETEIICFFEERK
jgi:hypothetical protein